jgi:hypothetical protein
MELFETKSKAQNHLQEICKNKGLKFNGFIYPNTGSEKIEIPNKAKGATGIEMLEFTTNASGNTVSRKITEYAVFLNY